MEMLVQPGTVVESPFLEGIQSPVDVAPGDVVGDGTGSAGGGWMVWEGFSNLNNSVIPCARDTTSCCQGIAARRRIPHWD